MARYNVLPNQGANATAPQEILHAIKSVGARDIPQCVWIENVGATPVYVSENQSALAQIDSNGNPTDGFVLAPNTERVLTSVTGSLFATSLLGGVINCTGWPLC